MDDVQILENRVALKAAGDWWWKKKRLFSCSHELITENFRKHLLRQIRNKSKTCLLVFKMTGPGVSPQMTVFLPISCWYFPIHFSWFVPPNCKEYQVASVVYEYILLPAHIVMIHWQILYGRDVRFSKWTCSPGKIRKRLLTGVFVFGLH